MRCGNVILADGCEPLLNTCIHTLYASSCRHSHERLDNTSDFSLAPFTSPSTYITTRLALSIYTRVCYTSVYTLLTPSTLYPERIWRCDERARSPLDLSAYIATCIWPYMAAYILVDSAYSVDLDYVYSFVQATLAWYSRMLMRYVLHVWNRFAWKQYMLLHIHVYTIISNSLSKEL